MPTTTQTPYRKKLIEVDLPLDAINQISISEKRAYGRPGHLSTLHQWWARRTHSACRAVIWASFVDDPSSCPEEFPTIEDQQIERQRLHEILIRLIQWDSAIDDTTLIEALYEIAVSIARSNDISPPQNKNITTLLKFLNENVPKLYDPFAGGAFIPVEAQRLGLNVEATDLNPVAVFINKAVIEIPQQYSDQSPVNQADSLLVTRTSKDKSKNDVLWRKASGIINDTKYYGNWMREEAIERIGQLYPEVALEDGELTTVSTWLWARTINCPNPSCGIQMPLLTTYHIWKKENQERWIKPLAKQGATRVEFEVQDHPGGVPSKGTVSGKGAHCVLCETAISLDYVRGQGNDGHMSSQLTAIVAQNGRGREFLSPQAYHEDVALSCNPSWVPNGRVSEESFGIRPPNYGFRDWQSYFTKRQITALATFAELISEVRRKVSRRRGDGYAEAVCTYLSLAMGKLANSGNSFTIWGSGGHGAQKMFARQGIGMIWDFPEINPFAETGANWMAHVESVTKVIDRLPVDRNPGKAYQADGMHLDRFDEGGVFITDPPYYDNVPYADFSDFFYIWLRPIMRDTHPEIFGSMLTPKDNELVANSSRSDTPALFFENSLNLVFEQIREKCNVNFPSSVFYAYKQQSTNEDGKSSTGWETMLSSLLNNGFQIVATWPIRTEQTSALKSLKNFLSTSVVIVVRPRHDEAASTTRQTFLEELETELPIALDRLTRDGHIAPADLPQAAIGPGMEIYSKYSRVETISGETVTVREALQQINRVIGAYFDKEEGELDAVTRFCIDWVKIHNSDAGKSGDADNIAQAKNVLMSDVANIHNLSSYEGGVTQLHSISEYHPDRRYPMTDLTAWEGCMRMAYHLDTSNEDGEGVEGCGKIGRHMAGNIDSIERLARILYNHYDNLNQPRNAYIYNQLVTEWQNILDEVQRPEERTLM